MKIRLILFFVLTFGILWDSCLASFEYKATPSLPVKGQEVVIEVRDDKASDFRFLTNGKIQDWGESTFTFTPSEVGTQKIRVEAQTEEGISYYDFSIKVVSYQKQELQFESLQDSSKTGELAAWEVRYFYSGGLGGSSKAKYRIDYDNDDDWDTEWMTDRYFSNKFEKAGTYEPTIEIEYPNQSTEEKTLPKIEITESISSSVSVSEFEDENKEKDENNESKSTATAPILKEYQTQVLLSQKALWSLEYSEAKVYWDAEGNGKWKLSEGPVYNHEYEYSKEGVYSPRVKIVETQKSTIYHLPIVSVYTIPEEKQNIIENLESNLTSNAQTEQRNDSNQETKSTQEESSDQSSILQNLKSNLNPTAETSPNNNSNQAQNSTQEENTNQGQAINSNNSNENNTASSAVKTNETTSSQSPTSSEEGADPQVNVKVSTQEIKIGEVLRLDASQSTGANLTYYWKIGGILLSEKEASLGVRFNTSGEKVVDLLVEDEDGKRDKVIFKVKVEGDDIAYSSIGKYYEKETRDPFATTLKPSETNGLASSTTRKGLFEPLHSQDLLRIY